ncbi:MAG: hypothetical protein IJT80_06975, partial [Lachnospiraceae bacterium]|nr:hypothetical protein [Lachnospiraceae bacterium]
MRKKTRRFIGTLLAMVLAFSSIGEAVPAFAADELILSDEIEEDTFLPDAESPEDVIADESGEDDTGIAGDVDIYLNDDAALDASAGDYADTAPDSGDDETADVDATAAFDIDTGIAADMDADTAATGDTQNTQDGKEPNPIADHYDIDGVCYYNVSSNNVDAEKLFYVDLINTRSKYLDGYSLGDLWMMTALAVNSPTADHENEYINAIKDCAKKGEVFAPAFYNVKSGKVLQCLSHGRSRMGESYTMGGDLVLAYSDFKVSPILPDSSVSGNYISTAVGDVEKPGKSAARYTNNGVDKIDAKFNISEGGSVTLGSTVNHSSSYSFEEGLTVGSETAIPLIEKLSVTLSFKATQTVQDGWSKSESKTQKYNTSREVNVSVPAHSVLMVKE